MLYGTDKPLRISRNQIQAEMLFNSPQAVNIGLLAIHKNTFYSSLMENVKINMSKLLT